MTKNEELATTNPFTGIFKAEQTLKIPKGTPIVSRTNCQAHGSILDTSGSQRFSGMEFFSLRLDLAEVFYEDDDGNLTGRDILKFLLIVLAENCRLCSVSDDKELMQIPAGTVMYFQLKANKGLSGSMDNYNQMKAKAEANGDSITGYLIRPSFTSCKGTNSKGQSITYAKCEMNACTATKEKHLKILQEVAKIYQTDKLYQSILQFDNQILAHYDALATKYDSLRSLPSPAERKEIVAARKIKELEAAN